MGALPDFKDILELIKKGSTVEAQEKIMQLREEHLSLREEVLKLREENSSLRERKETGDNLVFEAPYYWLTKDGQRDGPYCQVCWDRDSTLVRLQKSMGDGIWRCQVCKTNFRDKNFSIPKQQVVTRRRF